MIIVVKVTLVESLWDQQYMNLVLADWETNPIIDVKLVSQMDAGEIDYWGDNCPEDYEIVSKAYWMGFKTGCICASGSGYSEVDDVVCTDNMLLQGCVNVKASDFVRLPVIDGNKICAKRDTSYTYLSI